MADGSTTIISKTLRVPDEPRFVQAFALAVDPADTLGLLMEISALGSPELSTSLWTGVGVVRRTRKALIPAYDRPSPHHFGSARGPGLVGLGGLSSLSGQQQPPCRPSQHGSTTGAEDRGKIGAPGRLRPPVQRTLLVHNLAGKQHPPVWARVGDAAPGFEDRYDLKLPHIPDADGDAPTTCHYLITLGRKATPQVYS